MTPSASPAFTFDFFGRLEQRAQSSPDDAALLSVSSAGRDVYSWRRFVGETRGLSSSLIGWGVQPGDRIAILMENHPRWGVAFAAIQSAGGIAVPLDTLSPAASLASVVTHSQARFLIASPGFEAIAREIAAEFPGIEKTFATDAEWRWLSAHSSDRPLPHVARSIDEDLAILYTGGTTGKPKGVLLSQRGLYRSITDMLEVFPISPSDRILSVLPLFHIMPLLANLLAPLYTGAQVIFLAQLDAQQVASAFTGEGVTAFLCVPQFYYQMQRRILDEVGRQPRIKQWLFRRILRLSGFLRRSFGIRIGKRAFAPVHARFGKQLRAFGVGGAGFNPKTAEFFADLGFDLFQAYGLTECSGLATATPLDRDGGLTCGPRVAHTEVRILNPDADGIGEVLVRGENVMKGYWRDPEATAAAVREGWLHTGDLGFLTRVGVLRLTGRAKEVIVLSSGKNIFPEEIEEFFLANCALILEICIVGVEGAAGAMLHCLIVPDMEKFRDRQSSFAERGIRAEIETLARRLPAYKRPSVLHVLSEPLPRTTTRKLQRFKAADLARSASQPRAAAARPVPHAPSEDPVEREIVALIRRIRPAAGPMDAASSLELDIHLDSLERVELIANIERTFRIAIPEQQAATLFTVGDLAGAVKSGAQPATGQSAAEWRDWNSFLLAPFTAEETQFAADYLRPRPLAELFWFSATRVFRLFAVVLLRLRIEAPRDYPAGGFLVCANHASYLDDVLVPSVLPFSVFRRTFFLGASKYFRNPLLAWLGRRLRVIPVDTDAHLLHALRMGRAGIENGMALCVFPEGTRSFDGELQKLMKGPAVLAEALRVPVVAMGISGTHDVMPRAAGFGGLHPVRVSAGAPITPEDSESPEAFNERLRDDIALHIQEAAGLRK
jgi:long-chain acyl-CoA synthetase